MADRVYEIEFRTVLTDNATSQVKQGLNEITDQVESVDQSLKGVSVDSVSNLKAEMRSAAQEAVNLSKNIDSTKAATSGLSPELNKAASGMRDLNESGKLSGGIVQSFSFAANLATTAGIGFAGALRSMALALRALLTGNPIGLIVTAIVTLVSALKGLITYTKDAADSILAMSPSAESASRAIHNIETTKLDLKSQQKSVQNLIEQMNQAESATSKLRNELDQLEQQRVKTEIAKINASEKTAIAGAGGDEAAIAAISAKAEQQRASLEATAESVRIENEIANIKKSIQDKTGIQFELEIRRVTALEKSVNATNAIAQQAESLGLSMIEVGRLKQSAERLTKAIEDAEKNLDSVRADGLKNLQQAFNFQDTAGSSATTADKAEKSVSEEINLLNIKLETLISKQQEITLNAQSKGVDLGASSMAALNAIEKAIRDQERTVAAARQNVTNAQLNTGPGAGVAQNNAQADLATAEAELARLKTLQSNAAASVAEGSKTFGDSFKAGADGIQTAALNVQTKMDETTGKVKASGEAASKSVTDAAKDLDAAVGTATGQMGGSVEKLGSTIAKGFEGQAIRIEGIANSINNRIGALENRLNNVAADAENASNLSKQTAAKVNNSR